MDGTQKHKQNTKYCLTSVLKPRSSLVKTIWNWQAKQSKTLIKVIE